MTMQNTTGLNTPATEGAEPIVDPVLTMAYVPMQEYGVLYDQADALCAGTLYPDLDKPFLGKGASR